MLSTGLVAFAHVFVSCFHQAGRKYNDLLHHTHRILGGNPLETLKSKVSLTNERFSVITQMLAINLSKNIAFTEDE